MEGVRSGEIAKGGMSDGRAWGLRKEKKDERISDKNKLLRWFELLNGFFR